MEDGAALGRLQVQGDAQFVAVDAMENRLKFRPQAAVALGDGVADDGTPQAQPVQTHPAFYLDDLGAHIRQ